MKTWTVEEMLTEDPCLKYMEDTIRSLWAGREALSLREVMDLPIPAEDRLWVCWRPSALSTNGRKQILDRIVTRAVSRYALPHPVTRTWAERWLSGQDRSWEAAARAAEMAARAQARAVEEAAEAAPRAAEMAARTAEMAARAAEGAARAAEMAARAADAEEAATTERQQQIDDVLEYL